MHGGIILHRQWSLHNLNHECSLNQGSQKGANFNLSSWVRFCFAVLARLAKLVKRLTSDCGKVERLEGKVGCGQLEKTCIVLSLQYMC